MDRHANPMGTLHGGVPCDVADAAMGTAYASILQEGESFTTLELKVNFHMACLGRNAHGDRSCRVGTADLTVLFSQAVHLPLVRRRRGGLTASAALHAAVVFSATDPRSRPAGDSLEPAAGPVVVAVAADVVTALPQDQQRADPAPGAGGEGCDPPTATATPRLRRFGHSLDHF
jgi:Thioesterase superfamily